MRPYRTIKESLSFHGIAFSKPYHISFGKSILDFPKESFRLDCYALVVCISGTVTIEIDSKTDVIGKNTLLLASPATTVKVLSRSVNLRVQLLLFEKDFLLKNIATPFFIEKMGLFLNRSCCSIVLRVKSRERLLSLLRYLQQKNEEGGVFADDIIRTIIFNILLEIAELINKKDGNATPQPLKAGDLYFRFLDLVRQNVLERTDAQYYADRLFVTNKYLIKIVNKACGKTPHEVISEFLMKEAYVLLNDSAMNISDIADRLHFSNISSFSRFFKKFASCSPSEYRERMRLK